MAKHMFHGKPARVNSVAISLHSCFHPGELAGKHVPRHMWKITNCFDSELDLPYFDTFLCIIWL